MDTLSNIFSSLFTGGDIISIFFKLFAVVFGFLYLLYAFIFYRQIKIMNSAVRTESSPLLELISLVQLFAAIILLLLAVLFI